LVAEVVKEAAVGWQGKGNNSVPMAGLRTQSQNLNSCSSVSSAEVAHLHMVVAAEVELTESIGEIVHSLLHWKHSSQYTHL